MKKDCLKKIRALSQVDRLKIMRLLLQGPACVQAISKHLNIPLYNVSKHLRILEKAGLVAQEKNGQQRIYLLAPQLTKKLPKNKNKLIMPCCAFDFSRLKI